jgi:hypothetical protein
LGELFSALIHDYYLYLHYQYMVWMVPETSHLNSMSRVF